MAGLGRRTFAAGEVLTAGNVMGYLQDQAVMNFAGTAARGSAIASPSEGMMSYLRDTDRVQVYDGSAWRSIVESAANYVRFSSGIQICWTLLGGFGALAGNATTVTWTYPATFSSAPIITVSARELGTVPMGFFVGETTLGTASAGISKITGSPFQNSNYGQALVIAVGKWY